MGTGSVSKNRKPVIGVMGGANVSSNVYAMAFELGALIAAEGWTLLNGGRDAGVMRASAEGAKSKNGTTIGVLPGNSANQANPYIDYAIVTNMGDARNAINVLTSDVVVVCSGKAGTLSEAALALKSGKPVILLQPDSLTIFQTYEDKGLLKIADSPGDCVAKISDILENQKGLP